uniref:transcriptional regulator FtsR n=1 Tax=Vaginimicrobium propionicum TaxID=1871034 RepID=UPI0009705FBB|nr:MerR family transcriptional regulator [Vaginimicrobium propionicum]
MPPGPKRTIGQVMKILKPEFDDVSISKIRFLEKEGLLAPERAPSGYRKYSQEDINRLIQILRIQRDTYLPLKVIREKLEEIDRGGSQKESSSQISPNSSAGKAKDSKPLIPSTPDSDSKPQRFTRRQLLQISGVSEATFIELERQHMVQPRRGSVYYGREALIICVVARKLQGYGLDTRHLRVIKIAAERDVSLIEQAAGYSIRHSPDPVAAMNEVCNLVTYAHQALMFVMLQG